MSQPSHTIIAINPGTRYVGIAVFRRNQLIDWGVSVVTANSPHTRVQKSRALVTRYLAEYKPGLMVIKKLNPSLSSPLLTRLDKEIQTVARESGLAVRQYSIQDIERQLMPEKRINKRQLAALIVQKHPVLLHELKKEQDALNPYHMRMFEAVALGEVGRSSVNALAHT